jgi:hypothetical protein
MGASDGQNTISGKLDGQGQGNHPADISSEAPRVRSIWICLEMSLHVARQDADLAEKCVRKACVNNML